MLYRPVGVGEEDGDLKQRISLHLNPVLCQVVAVHGFGLSDFLRIESLIAMQQALTASYSAFRSKPRICLPV